MKTVIASLAAVAAVAAPAAAQPYGYNLNQRQERLDRRIEQGLHRGGLTMSEVRRLRAESRQIARLEARYRMNGLSAWERADLDRRFDRLEAMIRFERQDRDYGWRR